MGDRVFTGDTLLIRGTGRTDFQNGDPSAQYDSIFNRLLRLPDETLIYPAHDYKGDTVSTIGEERAFNPRLQVRSLEEYVDLMGSLNLPNPKMMDVAVPANMTIGLPIRPLHRDLLRAERLERHPHDLAKRRLVPRLLCQDVVGLGKGRKAPIESLQRLFVAVSEGLPGDRLHGGQRVLHTVVQLVHQELLPFPRAPLLGDVANFDDRPDGLGGLVTNGARSESDREKAAVLVNKGLFTLHLIVLGEGTVDGAVVQRERPPVRVGVMDDVVERTIQAQHLDQGPTGQDLRGPVHVDAVLSIIHHEDGHGGIVQHRFKAPMAIVEGGRHLGGERLVHPSPCRSGEAAHLPIGPL
jgi:hypothetical protein